MDAIYGLQDHKSEKFSVGTYKSVTQIPKCVALFQTLSQIRVWKCSAHNNVGSLVSILNAGKRKQFSSLGTSLHGVFIAGILGQKLLTVIPDMSGRLNKAEWCTPKGGCRRTGPVPCLVPPWDRRLFIAYLIYLLHLRELPPKWMPIKIYNQG